MSKECLEEIKEKYFMYENYTGKVIMYHHVLEWLIEQAERVQELENRIADDEHFVAEILEQNKRYREALEKIKLNVKICGNEEYFPKVVEEIVNEALEGEE